MKKIIANSILISFTLIFMLNNTYVIAQSEAKNWDLMLVREDHVKPFQAATYEAALGDMKAFLEENKVSNYSYFTHLRDDYSFTHIIPIDNLGDLELGIFDYVQEKVDNPGFRLIWNEIYESINSYRYYLIKHNHKLSYIPKNDDWGNGSPYRKWSYYYFKPGTEKEVEKILASWKQLYIKHDIKNGYRVFSGSIGLQTSLYIFTTWAEGPEEFQNGLEENLKLLGEEGAALWQKTMENVQKVETIEGWYLPQYSYTRDQKLASQE